LGSFPDLIKPITIRSILTHHSGIPGDIWNGLFARKFDPDFNKKLLAVLKDDCAHYPVDFFLMYSNTAVSLLSDVIARAAGKSFESCSDTFFSDLGMKHTSFYTDRPAVSDNRARGYYQGMPYGPFYANGPAAGSMISSVRDIAQFIRMMNARGKTGSGEVLEAQTLETMISRQNGNIPLDFDFQTGMMWKLTEPELAYAGRLCLHTGDRLFFQSYLEILTDHKLGVIVIANAVESAYGAQAEIAQKTLQLALAQKTGLNPPATPPVPAASPAESWPMDWLNNIAGIYSPLDDPTVVGTSPGKHYDRIIPAADGSGLQWTRKVNSTGQQVVLLVPRADGRFSPAGSQEYEYEFRPIENRIVMIQHHWGASWFMAERYVPATIPQTWQDRQGNYLLDNLDPEDWNLILPENLRLVSNRLELRVESDVLVMKLLDGLYAGELVVAPFSDILGYMPGGGRNLAGSVKAVMENGVVYLQFLGLRYKKIS
jgi:CubicO group peptidase (beta-lactamase class C family)